jgi:signal transduction histidine kinase
MPTNPGERMAWELLASDLFQLVLEHSESPAQLGRSLTQQLREMIGGRVVLLLEFEAHGSSEHGFRLLGACPERKAELAQTSAFQALVDQWRHAREPQTLRMADGSPSTGREDDCLRNMLLIPLRTSTEAVGMLVFLDLMDRQNILGVVSLLSELSTFIAVVLVNGRTFERQQQMLEARTAELRKTIDQLRIAKEEAEQARANAEAASEAKSRFLANMSHELRTPMNGVLGLTSLLLETRLDEDQRSYLGLLEKSGNTLLRIINNVLDIARIEQGREKIVVETFDLAALFRDVAAVFQSEVMKKNLELLVEVHPDVPELVRGDSLKWHEILYNLLGNAIKLTEKGHVTLRVHAEPMEASREAPQEASREAPREAPQEKTATQTRITVEISDTGIGIRDADRPRLFETFSQLDDSLTKRYQGTGLGLSITRRLVEMMGGTIEVDSVYGQGSVFTLHVPVQAVSI